MWQTSGIIIFIIYVDCSRKNGIESPGWWNVDLQVGGMRILWVFECYTENFSRKVCFFNSNILKNFLLGIGGAQKCPLRPISDQKNHGYSRTLGILIPQPWRSGSPSPSLMNWWKEELKELCIRSFLPRLWSDFCLPFFSPTIHRLKIFYKKTKTCLVNFYVVGCYLRWTKLGIIV